MDNINIINKNSQNLKKINTIKKKIENQIGSKIIKLEDLYIEDSGLEYALNYINKKNFKIESLFLRGNKLTGYSLNLLKNFLVVQKNLKFLSLEWNNINDNRNLNNFFFELENFNLLSLDLRSNKIDLNCEESILNFFILKNNILDFDLRWNEFGNTLGLKILEKIKNNKKIGILRLEGNGINQPVLEEIKKITDLNKKMNKNNFSEIEIIKNPEIIENIIKDDELFKTSKNIVRDGLVKVLKDDLIFEKEKKRNLLEKIDLLEIKRNEEKTNLDIINRKYINYEKENEILKNENLEFQKKLNNLEKSKKERIYKLESEIKNLELIILEKEKENAFEIKKIAEDTKIKIDENLKDWEICCEKLQIQNSKLLIDKENLENNLEKKNILLEKIQNDFKNEIKENKLNIRKEEMINFGEGLKNLENRIENIENKNFNKEKNKLENLENCKLKSRNKNI